MKNTFYLTLVAIAVALIEYAFSSVGFLKLVWVVAIVLFFSETEIIAVTFAFIAGLLTDLLLLRNAGMTGMGAFGGLSVLLLASSAGVASKEWQKVLVTIFAITACFGVDYLVRRLFGESVNFFEMRVFYLKGVVVNTIFVMAGIVLFDTFKHSGKDGKTVKLT